MDSRFHRPSSPGGRRLANPMRVTTGSVGYNPPYDPYFSTSPRTSRELITSPRSSGERLLEPPRDVPRNYKDDNLLTPRVRGEYAPRPRRATLDNRDARRPANILAPSSPNRARPIIHGASGNERPSSPLAGYYNSSDEGDQYYVTPATSGHRKSHRRIYSVDNDQVGRVQKPVERPRETKVARTSDVGPVSRAFAPNGVPARLPDSDEDAYGYSYMDSREPTYGDLARPRKRPESYEGGRLDRPLSMTGLEDYLPRVSNPRELGPPPSTRGFEKLGRSSSVRQAPRQPYPDELSLPGFPTAREADLFEAPASRVPSRRPVSLHQEPPDDAYPPYQPSFQDYDDGGSRYRRPHPYDSDIERRGFGIRTESLDRQLPPDERVDRAILPPPPPRDPRPPETVERRDIEDEYQEQKRRVREARELEIREREEELREQQRLREYRDRQVFDGKVIEDGERNRDRPRREPNDREIPGAERPRRGDRPEDRERTSSDEERRERHERRKERREREALERDAIERDGRERIAREQLSSDRDRSRDPREKIRDGDIAARPRDPREKIRDGDIDSRSRDPRDKIREGDIDVRTRDPREKVRDGGIDVRPRDPREKVRDADIDSRSRDPREKVRDVDIDSRSRDPREKARDGAIDRDGDLRLRERERESRHRDREEESPTEDERRSREARDRPLRSDKPIPFESQDTGREDRESKVRVASPPSVEKQSEVPIKGILKDPKPKFPEDPAPIREGVAPLKEAGKKGIPPGARWTKIDRKLVNPEALEAGHERFEERPDYVIVLRVLTKDEINAYAVKTHEIREERYERDQRERSTYRPDEREMKAIEAPEMAEPRAIEAPPSKSTRYTVPAEVPQRAEPAPVDGRLRENPEMPGTYVGYRRNPPPPRQQR
ncbi:MAG: hypothetical protein M1819_004576 [Sarea resinae]|nr:MAG: hypothetical protein M1819_006820 [Sarea resinae]KAI9832032.1 MAG: hypothetical protein M1819_004576 [Sarea resinae]